MKTTFKALILSLSGAPLLLAGATYPTGMQNVASSTVAAQQMKLTQEQVQVQARMQAQMMAEMAKMQAASIADTAAAQSEALARTATAQSEAMINTFEAMAQATKAMAKTFSQMADSMGSAYTSVSAPFMNIPIITVPQIKEVAETPEELHSSAPEETTPLIIEEVIEPVEVIEEEIIEEETEDVLPVVFPENIETVEEYTEPEIVEKKAIEEEVKKEIEEIEMPEGEEKVFLPATPVWKTNLIMRGRTEDRTIFENISSAEKENTLNKAYRRRTKRNIKSRESVRRYSDAQSILNAREKNQK
jgi:hypothetical protein